MYQPFTPPGEDAFLGTDYLGRDILAGLISGGRATLTVGGVAAVITIVIGVTIGSLAGFFGGPIDMALTKITEFFQISASAPLCDGAGHPVRADADHSYNRYWRR